MMTIPKLIKDRTTRKGWVKKLDKVVSEIVQLRDKKCVTCGSYDRPTAGHLFSRVAYSTEYDPFPFAEWFRRNHGTTSYNKIHRKFSTPRKFSTIELKNLCSSMKKTLDRYIEQGV